MKIKNNNSRSTKKIVAITIAAVLVVALGYIGFAYAYKVTPFNDPVQEEKTAPIDGVDYNTVTDEQQQAGDAAKEEFINNTDDNQEPSNNVTVTITSYNQPTLRVTVDAIDESGTCTLVLSKSGRSDVTQKVGTQVIGSYSVCEGFDIPVADLGTGDWQATITYEGSAGRGQVQKVIPVQ